MAKVLVQDAAGQSLSPCPLEKAERLVASGDARWISRDPLTIRLARRIALPEPTQKPAHPLRERRLLLHICCGPCSTFTVSHFQSVGAEVTGYWYNPNIHPFSEHERRRESLLDYTAEIGLNMLWEPGYDLQEFLRRINGRELFGQRCLACYRMRLEKAVQTAARHDFDAFSTTLLISPYQSLEALEEIGKELGAEYGVMFYFENLRRGFAQHHQLAGEHGLYRQVYCGCIYSEWESRDAKADTRARRG